MRRKTPANTFTQQLRAHRAWAGLNQRDTAARARMELTKFWRIENGYAVASRSELTAIARALRLSVRARAELIALAAPTPRVVRRQRQQVLKPLALRAESR